MQTFVHSLDSFFRYLYKCIYWSVGPHNSNIRVFTENLPFGNVPVYVAISHAHFVVFLPMLGSSCRKSRALLGLQAISFLFE